MFHIFRNNGYSIFVFLSVAIIILACLNDIYARDEIVGQIFYRTELGLGDVPSDIPIDITQVYLDSNSIIHLKTGVFLNLSRCTSLSLSSNAISSVEIGAFNGLDKLVNLNLYGNRLTTLENGTFTGLQNLESLNLASNYIEHVSVGSLTTLGNLTILELNVNRLNYISGDMWTGLGSLSQLNLQKNRHLHTILPGGFSNLRSLQLLHLQSNAIQTLSRNIFYSSTHPEWHPPRLRMSLDGNPLQCNASLCWIKEAEAQGWITWYLDRANPLSPNCANFPSTPWGDVFLDCHGEGNQFFLIKILCAYLEIVSLSTLIACNAAS